MRKEVKRCQNPLLKIRYIFCFVLFTIFFSCSKFWLCVRSKRNTVAVNIHKQKQLFYFHKRDNSKLYFFFEYTLFNKIIYQDGTAKEKVRHV